MSLKPILKKYRVDFRDLFFENCDEQWRKKSAIFSEEIPIIPLI